MQRLQSVALGPNTVAAYLRQRLPTVAFEGVAIDLMQRPFEPIATATTKPLQKV